MRHWKTEVVVNSLEMLSDRKRKEYARETEAESSTGTEASNGTGSAAEEPEEVLVAM